MPTLIAARGTALRVAVGCALVLAVTGGGPSGSSVSMARESSAYTLMQMNLCLSGFARCYGKVAYPAGVEEAAARIRAAHPDAVTLNETCPGGRRRDRTADRLPAALLDGDRRGQAPCLYPAGRPRALR